jgi:hypothetical protein
MTREQLALYVHKLKFDVELYRRTGKSFQDFFEDIMQLADSSFQPVKPMGAAGDWKSDGYSASSRTIYQCYAPEGLTAEKAAKKVKEDFQGAKVLWKEKMRQWVFVWSAESALPPQVVSAIAELKQENPDVVIDDMGRANLWKIVQNLPLSDRESILGVAPDLSDAPITTALEIQILMNHLGSHQLAPTDSAEFDLTAIVEKLKRNGLSETVTAIVRPATPVAKLVRDFVTGMPDPEFSVAIGADLAEKYNQFAASITEPDTIFGNLVEYVLGTHRLEPKFFWAAAGIVTHYFELCDVFER